MSANSTRTRKSDQNPPRSEHKGFTTKAGPLLDTGLSSALFFKDHGNHRTYWALASAPHAKYRESNVLKMHCIDLSFLRFYYNNVVASLADT